jgi:hypothetical protein
MMEFARRLAFRDLAWTVMAIATCLCAASCIGSFEYDQRGGPGIAAIIRTADLPIASDVLYMAGDSLDPASILITVRQDASATEIANLMCAVVVPAVTDGDPPADLGVWAGVVGVTVGRGKVPPDVTLHGVTCST